MDDEFDVFICYNSKDISFVRETAEQLKGNGISPWFDEWNLRPGVQWQAELEKQIEKINSVAVFIGEHGNGPWQNLEVRSFLIEFVHRKVPVIPVILPNVKTKVKLPVFLSTFQRVDFRNKYPDPLEQLIWGITGKHIHR